VTPVGGILSKWLVLHEYTVDGVVSDEAVERWVDAARVAYLDHCSALPREQLRHRTGALPPGSALGRPASVAVTASAAEVRPSSFTISVRLRPLDGDRDVPVNAAVVVRVEDPVTGEVRPLGDEVRDELIALEHSATHYN
jgi:hypothetical protein